MTRDLDLPDKFSQNSHRFCGVKKRSHGGKLVVKLGFLWVLDISLKVFMLPKRCGWMQFPCVALLCNVVVACIQP